MTHDIAGDTAGTAELKRSDQGHRHWQHGVSLAGDRHWREAARAFGRATRAAPRDALYWVNLANAQRQGGQLTRAVASARRALRIDATEPLALRLLGDAQMQMHRYAEAAEAFALLEAGGHAEPDAMVQHASVLQSMQRHAEAIDVLLRVLTLDPGLVRAHALLSDSCRDRGLKREAVECIKTVLALQPDNVEALSRMSFEKRHLLDWTDLDADTARLQSLLVANAGRPCITAAFALLSLPLSEAAQMEAGRAEVLALTAGVKPLPPVTASAIAHLQSSALPASARKGKLRLGWVSHDFRDHPVAQLLVEVLQTIDRDAFEVLLYASGPDDGSALRQQLVQTADVFVDLRGLSDAHAADRIRSDGVMVLVDLMGHTRGMRMGIFARRPAPLQVAYLGYPATSGADFIDYIVGDPIVTPLELAPLYTEKIAQLPLTLQPNGRNRPLPQPMSRADVGLPPDAFVLCAFNHTYKIMPPAWNAWCDVLQAVPHAVLWLKETNAQLHDNVRRAADACGIAGDRVVFAPALPYAQHFSRLALADVFVDTWPYNAHTTASDALWAGVPVVTLYGNSYASRVAASVVNAAGLGELAFENADDYSRAILALAQEPALLAAYRGHLTTQRMSLPLFDTRRYTRELEQLFQRMVGRWQAGRPPEHLPADADPRAVAPTAETGAALAGHSPPPLSPAITRTDP